MSVARLGLVSTLLLTLGCVLVVVALVLVRLAKDRAEQRRQTLRAPVWRTVLTLSSGEGDEVVDAHAALLEVTPSQREAVEADAFALLPKLRGDARERLRDVLRAWGTVDDARRSTTSRSAVRRCRGYYRLGVLAEPARRGELLAGLDDRDFIARRTCMLALGSYPDPEVVERMIDRTVGEPALRHDFLASVDRLGSAAVPVLRQELYTARSELAERPERGARRGQLVAEGLGLVGALVAVPTLERALADEAPEEMQVACIRALGVLGAPSSVTTLATAVLSDDAEVRRVAAQSLGLVGGREAVTPLSAALRDADVEVARAAADGLRRCGQPGEAVLRESDAPVAREVLALAAIGVREPS